MAAESGVLKRKYLKKANALKERKRILYAESVEEGKEIGDVHDEVQQLSPSPMTGQMVMALEYPSPPVHAHNMPVGVSCDSCDDAVTQNKRLSVQLEAQRRANQELKRLLVASVGSELNGQFERVAQEKAQLSVELEDTLRQLTRDWEEIERLAISADLWRSKFVASCVMVEELGQWREALVRQLRAGETALQDLLTQHVELGRALKATQEDLWHVHSSFAVSLQCEGRPGVVPVSPCDTVWEACASLQQMSSDLCEWVGPRRHPSTGHHVHRTRHHLKATPVETAAMEVLVSQDELLVACEQVPTSSPSHVHPRSDPSLIRTPRLPSLLKTFRAFLSSREDHSWVNFKCRKCKGKTLVV